MRSIGTRYRCGRETTITCRGNKRVQTRLFVIYYDFLSLSRPVRSCSSAAQSFRFPIVVVVGPARVDRLQTKKYRSNVLTVKNALLAHNGGGIHGQPTDAGGRTKPRKFDSKKTLYESADLV